MLAYIITYLLSLTVHVLQDVSCLLSALAKTAATILLLNDDKTIDLRKSHFDCFLSLSLSIGCFQLGFALWVFVVLFCFAVFFLVLVGWIFSPPFFYLTEKKLFAISNYVSNEIMDCVLLKKSDERASF